MNRRLYAPPRALGLALMLGGAAACSDGVTDPVAEGPSRVVLSYEGPLSGTFTAEGDVKGRDVGLHYTYAYGHRYQSPGGLDVSGVQYHSASNMVDGVRVQIPSITPGTFTIDLDRCPWWEDECAGVTFFLRLLNENGQQARYSCMLNSGTIRVSEATSSRAKGTFSGDGECMDRDDVAVPSPVLRILDGEFDVKLQNASRG